MENNEVAKQEVKPTLQELTDAFYDAVKRHYDGSIIVSCVMTVDGSIVTAPPTLDAMGAIEVLRNYAYQKFMAIQGKE